jgi:hypothetical protein
VADRARLIAEARKLRKASSRPSGSKVRSITWLCYGPFAARHRKIGPEDRHAGAGRSRMPVFGEVCRSNLRAEDSLSDL